MRWTSFTPSMISKTPMSKSVLPPTPPRTVWSVPVERWTSKPSVMRRSITRWICSGEAFSCMTTSIRVNSFQNHPVALHLPHFIDDALKDPPDGILRERPVVGAGDVGIDRVFALRLIDRHLRVLLH